MAMKACKICRAMKSTTELTNGRCSSCIDVMKAEALGISYGKMMGARYEMEQNLKRLEEAQRRQRMEEKREKRDERGAWKPVPVKAARNTACLHCGAPLRGKQKKYCSDECGIAARYEERQQYQAERREEERANLPPTICKRCGREFRDVNRSRKYCSEACRYMHEKERQRMRWRVRKGETEWD